MGERGRCAEQPVRTAQAGRTRPAGSWGWASRAGPHGARSSLLPGVPAAAQASRPGLWSAPPACAAPRQRRSHCGRLAAGTDSFALTGELPPLVAANETLTHCALGRGQRVCGDPAPLTDQLPVTSTPSVLLSSFWVFTGRRRLGVGLVGAQRASASTAPAVRGLGREGCWRVSWKCVRLTLTSRAGSHGRDGSDGRAWPPWAPRPPRGTGAPGPGRERRHEGESVGASVPAPASRGKFSPALKRV